MSLIKKIPLSVVMDETTFVVKEVTPRYRYAEGKRLNEIDGYSYGLVNPVTYDRIVVFVAQTTPAVSADDLRAANEAGHRVFVQIEDATITPYYSERTRRVEDSIKAASIRMVKGN